MTTKQKSFVVPTHHPYAPPPAPTESSVAARLAAPQPRFSTPFSSEGMSLPTEYLEEINRLQQKVIQSQPADILQFCANYFNGRLEEERIESFAAAGSPMTTTATMTNPFSHFETQTQTQEDLFGGFGGGGGFGLSTLDGSRDTIREEDDEITSPTAIRFHRPDSHHNNDDIGSSSRRSRSGRRSQSPGGRSTGGRSPGGRSTGGRSPGAHSRHGGTSPSSHRHRSHRHQNPSPSPFQSSGATHLSPDVPGGYNMNRRTSVSAESMVPTASDEEWSPPVHSKTAEQQERLRAAVTGNFLFSRLEEDQFQQVMLALVEKPIPAKDTRVITQGDVGDYFYVVEKGEFDIYVNSQGTMLPGPEGMGAKVASIGPGGSFGELALMYNAPRAATVISTSPGNVLWALDRVTFRRILMENTFKKRRMYEAFLEEVPILSSLVAYERSKIADALDTASFEAGETIIKEGDPGDRFYIIEQGQAEVVKDGQGVLRKLGKGDYFGELALLDDKPRAASVVAETKAKVAFLGKDGFQRLLGPVVDILRRNDPRLPSNAGLEEHPDGTVDIVEEAAQRNRTVEA